MHLFSYMKAWRIVSRYKRYATCFGNVHDPFGWQDHKPELELNVLSVLFDVYTKQGASQVVLMIKNLSANAGDIGNAILIPGLKRLPGGGHGNPLQHFCLENPMDRGARWATVHQVTKSQKWLKWLNMCTHAHTQMHRHTYIYTKVVFENRELRR